LLPIEFQIDKDGSGYIECTELKDALEQVGIKLPAWKVRQMISEFATFNPQCRDRLSMEDFEKV